MSIDAILIDARPGETRAALMEGERLVEILVDRGGSVVGNVYLGRVVKVLAGVQAALVDIGLDRPGFLGLAEARPAGVEGGRDAIKDYAVEGDAILVQATRDPFENKGARLTTRPALAGRYLVLTPEEPGVRVSRRIHDAGARERLERALDGDPGVIVRTEAANADPADLSKEKARLIERWREIRATSPKPPALLHADGDSLTLALRLASLSDLRRVVLSDPTALARARALCERDAPEALSLLESHKGPDPLFEAFGVEDQIATALAPRVGLPSGGSLLFGDAPALASIDVNTGGANHGGKEETALGTNLEAAPEIASQVRLRNVAGLIAVDFAPMRKRENRKKVLDALKAALDGDPRAPRVGGFTRFGLVEITRRRDHDSLANTLKATCPVCEGSGLVSSPESVALDALARFAREAQISPGATPTLTAPPAVVDMLRGPLAPARQALEERLGRTVPLKADPGLPPDGFAIKP